MLDWHGKSGLVCTCPYRFMLLRLLAAGPGRQVSVGLKPTYVPKVLQLAALAAERSFCLT